MKSKIILSIISIQIIVIIILLYKISQNKLDFFKVSVNTIYSNTLNKEGSPHLAYFYEPLFNSTEEVHKSWLSTKVRYTINRDTLNERYNYHTTNTSDAYRIIALGDSFTFGENVSTKDNYTEKLEDLLNTSCLKGKFEVINLGVRGYDIQYMLERYKKRGVKYKAQLVIMLFGDFQLFRMNEELGVRIEKIKKGTPSIDVSTAHIIASYQMIKDLGWKAILIWQKNQINKTMKSIIPNKFIIKLPILCMNNTYIWNNQTFRCKYFIQYDSIFRTIARERSDTYFLSDFRWDKKMFFQDGHPNIDGHKVLADSTFNYLTKNKLIPCN